MNTILLIAAAVMLLILVYAFFKVFMWIMDKLLKLILYPFKLLWDLVRGVR